MKLLSLFQKLFCSGLVKEKQELEELCERYLPSFRFEFALRVSGSELEEALRNAFPTLKDLKLADTFYHALRWDELKDWLNKDSLSKLEWIETVNDCDDFAMESTCRIKILSRIQSKNFTYGEAWGNTPMGYHAFCVAYVISEDGSKKVLVIEPQNDDTREWKKSDYKPDFIKM